MPTNLLKFFKRKIGRFDSYILGEILGPFFGGIIFFLFIFLMFQALRLADLFIIHGIKGWVLLKMIFLLSLSFLPFAIPVAFLIAVLVGFGRLSSDSELVAFKACGISLIRMAIPVTTAAVIIATLSLFLNTTWVPWGDRTFKQLLVKVGNTKAVASIREGAFNTGFFDLLIFADKIDSKNNRLFHVFIYDEREPGNAQTIAAQSGEILPVKVGSELGTAILLRLHQGSIYRNDISTNTYQKVDFGSYSLYLEIPEGTDTSVEKLQMIPQKDLVKKIAQSDTTSWIGREYRGEFWRRYSVALSPIIFAFLGIGFGTVRTRNVRAGAMLVALITLIVYWGIQSFGIVYGVQWGHLPAFWALQLPNIVVGLVSFWAFQKARW